MSLSRTRREHNEKLAIWIVVVIVLFIVDGAGDVEILKLLGVL